MARNIGFRTQDSGFRARNSSHALALVCIFFCSSLVTRHSSLLFSQLPAGTPVYNVNAKWVTDKGSQVYNVRAYGAAGNGATDDTTAILSAVAAAGAGGTILFPPGSYLVSSQVPVTANHQTFLGYGAILKCNLTSANDCVMIGTTAGPSYSTTGVSIYGLHLAPGPNTSGSSGFRDNAQSTHFYDVGGTPVTGSAFFHFLENDNDQAETVDHLYDMAGVITCNASSCGSALWSPGGSQSMAGITWLQNSDLSMGCSGNSIDWNSPNHLTVSRSILQAFSQFALRSTGNSVDIDGWTHWEQGNCTNPLNDGNGHALGGAGLVLVSSTATAEAAEPGGASGSVFSTNSPGSTVWWYYIVAHTASGVSAPLLIGWLQNGPATIGSSATVATVWPAIPAATSYDLLRGTLGSVPYGTGNWAVATGLTPASVCGSNGVCAYTDAVGSPSSYTVPYETWYPGASFWPGNIVLFGPASGTTNSYQVSTYQGPSSGNGIEVNSAPNDMQKLHVSYTGGGLSWGGNAQPYGPGLAYTLGTSWNGIAGLLLPKYPPAGTPAAKKGVINLGMTSSYGPYANRAPTDLITFFDSNYPKTLADQFKRPAYDAGDSAICEDYQSGQGLCVRAGSSISQYVNTSPDGSSWLERLTATQKTLKVPFSLGGGTAITTMNLYSTASITPAAVSASSCSDQTFAVSGLVTTDMISNITPPSALGNLSLNGYAVAAGTALLHFCNPSASPVTPPPGVYSFLAVH